jgi:hypothetical protein
VSIYIGPNAPRWKPSTWDDLLAAQANGWIDENQWIELKSGFPAGKAGGKKLAKEAAALSVEGGILILGVDEDDTGAAGELCGVELPGLAERVTNAIRASTDPTLFVRTQDIPSPDAPHRGCLLVEVPASGQAPHQADGTYYGRADRTSAPLSDTQVQALMQRRDAGREQARTMLRELVNERDPRFRSAVGTLFLVIHPDRALDDGLVEFLTSDDGPDRLRQHVLDLPAKHGHAKKFHPEYEGGLDLQPSSNGYKVIRGRTDQKPDGDLRMVVQENGAITVLCAQATRYHQRQVYRSDQAKSGSVVFPDLLLGLTRGAVILAGQIADDHLGYQGSWHLGLHISGVWRTADFDSFVEEHNHQDLTPRYDQAAYEMFTESTTAEMTDDPAAPTGRLLGRLLRALGIESRYPEYRVRKPPQP